MVKFNRTQLMLVLFALWALAGQHFFIHHLGGVGLDLPLNAQAWLMVGLLLVVGGVQAGRAMVLGHFWPWLAAGAVLLWLPWFFEHSANTRLNALPRLLGLLLGVLFYWVLLQARLHAFQRRWLLWLLLGLAGVQMGFALVQFFVLPADNWFHFNTRVRLPYGIFMQRNVMASLMASAVLLALYLLITARGGRWRGWQWGLCLLLALTGIVLVVLLQSRAGLYSLLAGLALLLPVCWFRLHTRGQRWLVLSVVLAAAVAGVVLLLQSDLHRRMLEVYGELGVRVEIWRTTLGLVAEHFWQGVGYGGFERAYYAEAGRLLAEGGAVPRMPPGLHHPHNELLLWLVEGGAWVLVPFALWLVGVWRLLRRLPASERLALLALSVPVFAHALSEYPFEHSVVHWLWLLVLWWFFDSSTAPAKRHWPVCSQLMNAGTSVAGVVLVVFMATGLHSMHQLMRFERGEFADAALLQVSNPWVWFDRLALYQQAMALEQGLHADNKAAIADYVAWSEPVIQRLPRVSLLHNHLVALLALGREAEAREMAARLRLNFVRVGHFSEHALQKILKVLQDGHVPRVYLHLSQPVGSATYYGSWKR